VNATLAIWVMSIPCAESSTICARRHVTTDPEQRRTIRNSRLPSSFANSQIRNPSRTTPPDPDQDQPARPSP
jgi:hypothetical protein